MQGVFTLRFLIRRPPQPLKQALLSTCCQLQEEFSTKGSARSRAALSPAALAVGLYTASLAVRGV